MRYNSTIWYDSSLVLSSHCCNVQRPIIVAYSKTATTVPWLNRFQNPYVSICHPYEHDLNFPGNAAAADELELGSPALASANEFDPVIIIFQSPKCRANRSASWSQNCSKNGNSLVGRTHWAAVRNKIRRSLERNEQTATPSSWNQCTAFAVKRDCSPTTDTWFCG